MTVLNSHDVRCVMYSGGAGGKGVWGAPGSELLASDAAFDENDPNYDSDDIQVSSL
jgi:hypothetical protein